MGMVYIRIKKIVRRLGPATLIGLFFCMMSSVMFGSVKPHADVPGIQQDSKNFKEVSGVVIDENGDPIIGANIKVKGLNTNVVTDLNGRFTVVVPKGSKFTVSFVGYVSQVLIPTSQGEMKITMQENSQSLNEVVVMGYGTQKKKDLTGSVAVVTGKDIADIPTSNVIEALKGQVPGLSVSGGDQRPGDQSTLYIRQANQFTFAKQGNDSAPLVVIDDVIQVDPSTGLTDLTQLNMLDPSEIESITVLRDASAAIYGSRAANGAIIVKTKKGQAGVPRISYSGLYGVLDAAGGQAKEMSAYQYGLFANSFLQASNLVKSTDSQTTRANEMFSDDELNQMKGLNYNWLKQAWKAAFTQRQSVNVSGGTDKATYYAGLSYYSQGANLGNQNYNKYTFRSGVDINLTSNLKLSASLAANMGDVTETFTKVASLSDGSYGSKANSIPDYTYLAHMPRYIPWSTTIGGQQYYVSPSPGPNMTNNGTIDKSGEFGAWNYFALANSGSKSQDKTNSWNADFSFTYAIPYVKGLSLQGTYAISRSTEYDEQMSLPYQLADIKTMDTANKHLYSEWTSSDYTIKTIDKNSRVTYDTDLSENRQLNFFINYQRSFGLHNLQAMGGMERTESSYTSEQQLYNTPTNYIGSSATAGTFDATNSYVDKDESGTLSYFGRVNYNYADRYLLQLLFRTDASTKFAPQNYWGFFPGVSAGWVASEEDFFKKAMPWFEYLKVRASWGRTGRDNIAAWEWRQAFNYTGSYGYEFGSTGGQLGYGYVMGKAPNANVHWDKDDKYNLGFDTRFLRGRLSATLDFYYEVNSQILNAATVSAAEIPFYVGGSVAESNYGRIDTWGNEISVNWRDHIGDLKYGIGVNFGLFGGDKVKRWPTLAASYPSANNIVVGGTTSAYMPTWGFKVWKGTTKHDGILRNQTDIDNYWAYLTANAGTNGNPEYFGATSKSTLEPGMLAYQDLGGPLTNGKVTSPDGQIDETGADYSKLYKGKPEFGIHSFTTNLNLEWNGLIFSAQIGTSWGGANTMLDIVDIKGKSSSYPIWSPEYYFKDMFDSNTNPNGKYPNLGCDNVLSGSVNAASDFWELRRSIIFAVNHLSIGYVMPHQWTQPLHIESARISLQGNNVWTSYNPYPYHYRSMYTNSYSYPVLRNWSLGVNLTF